MTLWGVIDPFLPIVLLIVCSGAAVDVIRAVRGN
jgi:hypothetical protein